MPTEDDVQGMERAAITDPYTGQHPDSIYAIWHDPSAYDLMKHGPPYLPDPQIKTGSTRKTLKDAVRPLVEKTSADALTSILVVATHIKADFSDTPLSVMAALVAFLRGESMVHQAHHWQSRGPNAYGDHLLFERLYNGVIEDLDKLAERMVGSSHPVLAYPVFHAKHTSAVVQTFYDGAPPSPTPDENVMLSLRAVLYTLVLIKFSYSSLEQQGLLSHGIDNLLQGIADKHEEHVYLLRQRAMQKSASYDRRPVASGDPQWK
jgi:DNA-binding ferritin-like protein